jgi:pimeloyl-ACP methyl ester carboxylesterase
VLDWGGRGTPVVLLAGLPHTAHVFDDFAQRLTRDHHVYGITRRGFGRSGAPQTGYSSDELAADDLAVIAALGLKRPLLIGHSFAGLELSSIGLHHPEQVAGIIYLDANFSADPDFEAGLWYADRYGRQHLNDLKDKIAILDKEPGDPDSVIHELIDKTWPAFHQDLEIFLATHRAAPPRPPAAKEDLESFATVQPWYARGSGVQLPEAEFRQILTVSADGHPEIHFRQPAYVSAAIRSGGQKFTGVTAPALGIFAIWDRPRPADPSDAQAQADARAYAAAQAERVGFGVEHLHSVAPHGEVVQLHLADHYVFLSNQDQVLQEIHRFLSELK